MKNKSLLILPLCLLAACSVEEVSSNIRHGSVAAKNLVLDYPGTLRRQRAISAHRFGNPDAHYDPAASFAAAGTGTPGQPIPTEPDAKAWATNPAPAAAPPVRKRPLEQPAAPRRRLSLDPVESLDASLNR